MTASVLSGLRAVATVLASSLTGALVIGNLWLLIGWMRFYGLEPGVVASAVPLEPVQYNNFFLNETGRFIDSYNLAFQGNARFGSGIGAIAGAGLALLALTDEGLSTRATAAAIAGAITGGRFALTFTSSPVPFLVSTILGLTLFVLVQLLTHERLNTIPKSWSRQL
jgi:hypothetical protein